ncbi:hypothetical protein B0I35DRAFT_352111 [Stachybotrys elegans]|uniref:Zn(2)-C6 fungal-type domain-containing protein n=1 Tax=Stachybotrys elegans TaxID=80388 RepID=A0A8K0SW53_9HYPO|nr:hypothetical protein B0I35DRAFT_352111 [Stachybotrys elegans]
MHGGSRAPDSDSSSPSNPYYPGAASASLNDSINDDHEDHDNHASEGQDHESAEHKKMRACEACRGLKVRCEPDPDNEDAPCRRCSKAGRNCVVTLPTRKRRKKTDSRVAELEKKIDALTASLSARGSLPAAALPPPPHPHPIMPATSVSALPGSLSASTNSPNAASVGSPPVPQRPSGAMSSDESSGPTFWGNRRWGSSTTPTPPIPQGPFQQPMAGSAPREQIPAPFPPPMVMAGQKRKGSERRDLADDSRGKSPAKASTPTIFSKSIEGDVVDRGILSMDLAAELFARYNDRMVKHVPAVIFPPHMTVADLRKNKPTLFVAVMAVTSSMFPNIQRTLQRELMLLFAEKVFLSGEKSLEIVQALQLSVIWYYPPENYEELKFYQLVHIGAIMAIDIGLGKKPSLPRRGVPSFTWNSHPFRRQAPCDPLSIEGRRTWLVAHFLCANTSMALRRPILIRWTPFMSQCVEVLQSSPDAAPSDKYLCHLIWTHRLGEEVGLRFSLDDEDAGTTITDSRVQHSLRAMELDAKKYRASVPKELHQTTLKMGFDFISLYMHEVALRSDTSWRPPFNTDQLTDGILNSEPLSPAQVNAFSACLDAVNSLFTTFLELPIDVIHDLPVYCFVRVAYSIVLLLKMYFSLSSSNGELGKIIEKNDLRVEFYLENLLEKFRAAAADDKCRPAAKFLLVLAMLRSWFFKQTKEGDRPGVEMSDNPTLSEDNSRPVPQHNTPLQLLSEVATSGNSSTSSAVAPPNPPLPPPMYSSLPNDRQPFFFHDRPPSLGPQAAAGPSNHNMGGGSATDFAASSAWMAPGTAPADLGIGFPGNSDRFLDSLGIGLDSGNPQDMYEGSVKMFMGMSEPWFNDVIQDLPNGNMFPF